MQLFLVGAPEEGRKIGKAIHSTLHPGKSDLLLELNEVKGDALMKKVGTQISRHPESTIIIDTSKIDGDASNYLSLFLDDTSPYFTEEGSKIQKGTHNAVFVLLADLPSENPPQDSNGVRKMMKERWADRVVQRIRNVIFL